MIDEPKHDLFSIPGHRGVETSIEAARVIQPAVKLLTGRVMVAVTEAAANGITVVEMAMRDGLDRMAIQPRFSELRKAGKIADSGLRRKNPSGVNAIVWTLPAFVLLIPERKAA